MFKMKADEVIVTLVELMLPRGSGNDKILIVPVQIAAFYNGTGGQVSRLVMFLFHRSGNYTKVLLNVTKNFADRPENFKTWTMKSNHDSAWRYDGVTTTLGDLSTEIARELGANNISDCEITATFAFTPPRLVNIKDLGYSNREALIEW